VASYLKNGIHCIRQVQHVTNTVENSGLDCWCEYSNEIAT